MRRDVPLTLTVIAMLSACGPEKSNTTDGSGGGSSSGTVSAGSATDPTDGATAAPTGSATAMPTTGEPLSCDAFLPPPPEAFKSVEITITSKLAVPVWIGAVGCGGLPLLRILDAGAEDLFEGADECFPRRCHEFIGADDCSLGCNDCGGAVARRIGPGSQFTMNWSAARGVPMQMTAACAPGTDCQRECVRPEPVPAGTYRVELTAFRTCTGLCDCDVADPNASCALWELIETAEPFAVEVSVVYPETGAIELVLE